MGRRLRPALAFALLALVVPAAAADPRKPPNADRRDDLKKRIRVMRAYTLTEELNLDEHTTGRLFPVLAKYDDITDQLLATRAELQRRLNNPPADPHVLDKLIDDSIANQHALWDAQDRRLGELRRVLSPPQIARLLVVLPALERRVENQLRDAAGGKGLKPGKDNGNRHVVEERGGDDTRPRPKQRGGDDIE